MEFISIQARQEAGAYIRGDLLSKVSFGVFQVQGGAYMRTFYKGVKA